MMPMVKKSRLAQGDCKLTGDEQPVSAHPENYFAVGCMSALEFIDSQLSKLTQQGAPLRVHLSQADGRLSLMDVNPLGKVV